MINIEAHAAHFRMADTIIPLIIDDTIARDVSEAPPLRSSIP